MAYTVRDLLNQIYDATSNAINVIVGSGATDLGKAEDAAHASGDVGVQTLAVRNDALAALAGTDGDYSPLQVDAIGGLYVSTKATIIDVVLSMNAAANHANDVLAATQEIALATRVNGGTGVLQSIMVQDDDDNGGAIDIVILDSNTSIGTENAAVSMADNDTVLGIVSVLAADFVDMINGQCATMNNLGIVVKSGAASTSLYVGVVMRDAGTVTASGMTLRFGFLQD